MPAISLDPITPYEVPKAGGGVRRMARLSSRDAGAWDRLAHRVAPAVERTLGQEVAANRMGGRHLEPVGRSFDRARRLTARAASGAGAVLRTDVADFYPSIRPGTLRSTLDDAGAESSDAQTAAVMLEGWGSKGYAGLPIGPYGSGILANAVLRQVDEVLSGLSFVRWVDDYLIGLPSEAKAAEILERMDAALARLGLRRSVPKTAVLDPRRAPWPGRASALSLLSGL